MRIFLCFSFVIANCILMNTKISKAADYNLCENDTVKEALYVLSAKETHPCWTNANGTIDYSKLNIDGEYIKFAYLFEARKPKEEYDRILSVQIKEPRLEEIDNDEFFFRAFREKMSTLCRDEPYPPFDSISQASKVSLAAYNRYHNGNTDEAGVLRRFHIEFKTRLQKCIQSNDKNSGRRKSFVAEGGPVQAPSGLLAWFSNLLVTEANAITNKTRSKFRSVSVEILKGKFQSGLIQNSFKVKAIDGTQLVVRDLSKPILSRAHVIKLVNGNNN